MAAKKPGAAEYFGAVKLRLLFSMLVAQVYCEELYSVFGAATRPANAKHQDKTVAKPSLFWYKTRLFSATPRQLMFSIRLGREFAHLANLLISPPNFRWGRFLYMGQDNV
jgi:hypothetical protein